MNRRATVALVALVAALPIAAWWVIGDLSEPGEPLQLDFMFDPPRLSQRAELGIGLLASAVVVGAAVACVQAWRGGDAPAAAAGPIAVLLVVGVFAGWGYRVVTAGVIGANIGGGFVLLLLPMAGVAVLLSALRLRRIARSDRGQPGKGIALV